MGWNTVVFILNDQMSDIEKAPKTVAHMLSHPPMSERGSKEMESIISHVAQENGEPRPWALEVLPTFHADEDRFYVAGGNRMKQLKFVKWGTDPKTGKKTVTLEMD